VIRSPTPAISASPTFSPLRFYKKAGDQINSIAPFLSVLLITLVSILILLASGTSCPNLRHLALRLERFGLLRFEALLIAVVLVAKIVGILFAPFLVYSEGTVTYSHIKPSTVIMCASLQPDEGCAKFPSWYFHP